VIAQHGRDSRVADGVSEAVAADQVTSGVAQGWVTRCGRMGATSQLPPSV
jgi:hypothetical protein